MTRSEYLSRLVDAGFPTSLVWAVPYFAGHVECHRIDTPNGKLLTTMILWETPEGVVPYFCAEGVAVSEDIEDLKGLWSKRIQRNQSRRPVEFKSRAVVQPEGTRPHVVKPQQEY